jgi:hypothetical protein
MRSSNKLHSLRHPLLTNRGVTQSTQTDLTSNHLTGIETQPKQANASRRCTSSRQALGLLLDVQCSQPGTKGVIPQRSRCTEDRHDAIAGELVHRAAVALHHRRRTSGKLGHDLAQSLSPYRRSDM